MARAAPEKKVVIASKLFVGDDSRSDSATLDWEPYHVAHYADGALSFIPLADSGPASNGFTLAADWRQPFTVAPWAPLSSRSGSSSSLKDLLLSSIEEAEGAAGREGEGVCTGKKKQAKKLYPFSLSYIPLATPVGLSSQETTSIRTVFLAAPTGFERSRWIKALEHKARTPGLRKPTAHPAVAPLDAALLVPAERRSLQTVGEELSGLAMSSSSGSLSGLLKKPSTGSQLQGRLRSGPAGLWDRRSRYQIVRDLYEEYAADPVSANPLVPRSPSSSSQGRRPDASLPRTPTAAPESDVGRMSVGSGFSSGSEVQFENRHMQFFVKYMTQQAKIENLLDTTWAAAHPPGEEGGDTQAGVLNDQRQQSRGSDRPASKPLLLPSLPRSMTEPGSLKSAKSPQRKSHGDALDETLQNQDRAAKAGDGTRGSGRLSASGPLDLAFEAAEARTADRTFQLPCPRLGTHTANVTLSKDAVLANSEWSGGALFELPETFHLSMADRGSFEFSVSPLTPLVRHPVFLGIVPADTDLNKVNVFTGGRGIFLCMGGQGSKGERSLGTGLPCFFTAGGCHQLQDMPELPSGGSFSVHFQVDPDVEKRDEGKVLFKLEGNGDAELARVRPQLPEKLKMTLRWRPCVLLSHPQTRVRVAQHAAAATAK